MEYKDYVTNKNSISFFDIQNFLHGKFLPNKLSCDFQHEDYMNVRGDVQYITLYCLLYNIVLYNFDIVLISVCLYRIINVLNLQIKFK